MKHLIALIREKYTKIPLPAKATIWFTICSFFVKGVNFLVAPIFTHLIPEDQYGILSIFLSYEQLLLILATWEIQLGAHQKGLFKFKDNADLYTSSTLFLINLLTVIAFAFVFIFNRQITVITKMPFSVLFVSFVYLLLRPAYNCWLNRKRKSYEYRISILVTIIYSVLGLVVPIIAVIVFGRTAIIKHMATLFGYSAVCFVLYICEIKHMRINGKKRELIQFSKFNILFSAPGVFHSLSFLILAQADRVMIGNMVGDEQAAFYSVAYSIASAISILQISITQSITPWRYQKMEDRDYSTINQINNALIVFFALAILMFILIAPELMILLFPSSYYESIWCIPPISCSVFFMFLYSVYVSVESYFEKTYYVAMVSLPCGIINILLNYIFIKRNGYIVCAYTTLFSYILFAIGHYLCMCKIMRQKSITERIIDSKIVILVSLSLLISTIIITFSYNNPVLRYIILFVVLFVVFIKRKELLMFFVLLKKKK